MISKEDFISDVRKSDDLALERYLKAKKCFCKTPEDRDARDRAAGLTNDDKIKLARQ